MTQTQTKSTFREDCKLFTQFIPRGEAAAIAEGLQGEETDYFAALITDYAERIRTAPRTYDQDGLGQAAIVHFHYFRGSQDWYITELDSDPEQHQAFGLANLFRDGGELGYISIPELVRAGVELDLHWTPKPLSACKVAGR